MGMNEPPSPGAARRRPPAVHPFRALPAVERVLAEPAVAALIAAHGHPAVAALARAAVEEARARLAAPSAAPPDAPPDAPSDAPSALAPAAAEPPTVPTSPTSPTDVLADVVARVVAGAAALEPPLRGVINATGVVVHTNLGRAPLSRETVAAMGAVSAGYSNLEFDLAGGERGSRFAHLDGALRRVSGAEAGLAVNNNAAAVLLALAALCAPGEVILSRGQLVEIGGGFRIPEVLAQSGATLVEVGTTNRTRLADYERAITERTRAILRVHPSNFRVVGFTEEVALPDLVALAHRHGVPLLDDLGSGALLDPAPYGLAGEPLVAASVAAGADVVLFSGDKLLGGPQAGIAVGRRAPLAAMRAHPLARALRPDKATIAGLTATLRHYERGEATTAIPVWRMIAAPLPELTARAQRWIAAWNERAAAPPRTRHVATQPQAPHLATLAAGRSVVGGGALPGEGLPAALCAIGPLPGATAAAFAAALRAHDPPIIARVDRDHLLLDPRTVDPADDARVVAALDALAGAPDAG